MKVCDGVLAEPKPGFRRAPAWLVLVCLLILGMICRIGWDHHQGWSTPPVPGSDASEYDMYAWNLAQGLGYSGISPDVVQPDGQPLIHLTAYRSPGTSFSWAALYRVFGHRYSVIRVSAILIDTATIFLVYMIGYTCYGNVVGLLAATVYALWPTALIYTSQLASETQYTLFLCLFILLSLQFAMRTRWLWAVGAGLALGMALLTRGNAIFMLVLIVPWCVWQFRKVPRTMVRSFLIPTVAVLTLVPWAVRNYRVFHTFIPFQTGGGDVLLGSYNRITASDPTEYGYWIYPVSSLPEYRDQIVAPNNEVVRDQVEKKLAVDWLRSHPETWWYFLEAKFRRSWTPFLQPSSPLMYRVGSLVSWGPVLILFAVGVLPTLVCAIRTDSPNWILHLGIFHFVLTAEVFWGSSRFRYPVEGLVIVIASVTVVWLYQRLMQKKTSPVELRAEAAG